MSHERLGAERTEILRRWGQGLAASGRDEEMRATGRATLLLTEEIDALQSDLWHARAHVSGELPGKEAKPEAAQPQPTTAASESPDGLGLIETLTMRLNEHLPAFP